MRIHAAVGIVTTLAILAGTSAGWAQAPEARGQEVFAEQRCVLCHSVGGEGNVTKFRPPNLPLDFR